MIWRGHSFVVRYEASSFADLVYVLDVEHSVALLHILNIFIHIKFFTIFDSLIIYSSTYVLNLNVYTLINDLSHKSNTKSLQLYFIFRMIVTDFAHTMQRYPQ